MYPVGDREISTLKPGWDQGNSTNPPVTDGGPRFAPFASLKLSVTPE